MLQDLSLERFLIPPDEYVACPNVEALAQVSDASKSGPAGLGFHPELGWFVLCSGQGPFLAWSQRGDPSKWTGGLRKIRPMWPGKIHADDWFSIGAAHTVCQDYSRSQDDPKFGRILAAVSDGCSGSPDSDFGSRFIIMSALWETINGNVPFSPKELAAGADTIGYSLFQSVLKRSALDATLLSAVALDDGTVQAQAFGDGAIFVRRRDGSTEFYEIDHGGVPAYPSYLLVTPNVARYKAEHADKLRVKATVDGVFIAEWEISSANPSDWPEFGFNVDPADADLVVVMTDGIQSFQDMTGLSPKAVLATDVVPKIVGYKNMTGAFVGRRLHAFETKECLKLNWRHYDDFAVAALWMEETK